MAEAPFEPAGPAGSRLKRRTFLILLATSGLPLLLVGGWLLLTQLGVFRLFIPVASIGLFLVSLLLLAGGLWLLSGFLTRPVVEMARTMNRFVQGDVNERAFSDRNDELGDVAMLFNQVADELKDAHHLLSIREPEEHTTARRSVLSLLAQYIGGASSLMELQRSVVELSLRHASGVFAALYMIERSEPVGITYANLVRTAGTLEGNLNALNRRFAQSRINLDALPTMDWQIGKALTTRQPQSAEMTESIAGGARMADRAGSSLYEAAVPLVRRTSGGVERVVAILDLYAVSRVQDDRMKPFARKTMDDLQAIANLAAPAIEAMAASEAGSLGGAGGVKSTVYPARSSEAERTLAATSGDSAPIIATLQASHMDLVFKASRLVVQAETSGEAIDAAVSALAQSAYISALLLPVETLGPVQPATNPDQMRLIGARTETPVNSHGGPADGPMLLSIEPLSQFLKGIEGNTLIVEDVSRRLQEARSRSSATSSEVYTGVAPQTRVPEELLQAAMHIGAESAAFLPIFSGGRLGCLVILGRPARPALRGMQAPPLNPTLLEPYHNLVSLLLAFLNNLRDQVDTRRKLNEMEAVIQMSQTVATQSDLDKFYPALHSLVESSMGKINSFAILLYDPKTNTIHVPYSLEDDQPLAVPPFQLDNEERSSLSAYVVRTRQPLLLRNREQLEEIRQQTGMVIVGEPPQSWLGAPMLYAGELIGLIVVQDPYNENRFDEEDRRLLGTLATQAAVMIRNARILDTSRRQMIQEQRINEITARIRRSTDIDGILKTTAEELGKVLGAQQAHIWITGAETVEAGFKPAPTEPGPGDDGQDGQAHRSAPMDAPTTPTVAETEP